MALSDPAAVCGLTFDYIIAGGGTAGLTLAARLSENPSVSVAVIEAGEDRSADLIVTLGGLTAGQFDNPAYDWSFKTTPQTSDDDRVIAWPRERQLGGSSAINLQVWNRASRDDIDSWGELGNDGWTWEELLPYFLKSESFITPPEQLSQELDITYIEPNFHGENGPIKVSYATTYDPFDEAWNPTFENLGIGFNGDPFNGIALGGFASLLSQDPETVSWSYATTAYHKPVAGRSNLKVLTNSLVTKVLFQAEGIEILNNGTSCQVKAKREVILSAGVVQSPQLLKLSGIGSRSLLESLGIEVLIDNPGVGENLQDHIHTSVGFEVADGLPTFNLLNDPAFFQAALDAYFANRSGILTNGASSASLLSYQQLLDTSKTESRLPAERGAYAPTKEELRKVPSLAQQYELITRKLLNANEAAAEQIFIPGGFNYPATDNTTLLYRAPPGNFLTLFGFILHPYSRGSVHTTSSDPTAFPAIDPRYLSNPIDLVILSTIALQTLAFAKSQPSASLLKDNGTVYATGYQELTPENVDDHVRKTLTSIYHGIGTCSMLPRNKGGVVDSRLKVYGTKNLRVVDSSVAPLLTRGTIQSFVYAIAERAADMIKADFEN